MKIKVLLITFLFILMNCKINNIETIDNENEYIPKKIKKITKKVPKEKLNADVIKVKLSFYTDLDIENYEGCGGITAVGVKLHDGVVANNLYKFGTKVIINGKEYKVLDRGGKGLNTYINFDVFVHRNYGESDREYYKRVNNMGIVEEYAIVYSE